jgi:membrane protein
MSPVFSILKSTFKRFGEDRCFNFSITVSYFALLCAIPLAGLFIFLTTKILGSAEIAIRSLNILSDEFFAKMDPMFFTRVQVVSRNISNLGWFGFAGSFIAASFLFSNLIHAINVIFRANFQKSFFYSRLMEYLIMFVIGVIMLISLSITVIWTGLHRAMEESDLFATYINPRVMALADNFILQYLVPFTLTFLVFFILYKFIPEIKVHTKSAAIAAVVSTLLWETFKRIFAFYVANFSAIGVVLSRLVQGTLTSIIFFLLWLSFSLAILFWGAELAAVLSERHYEKIT